MLIKRRAGRTLALFTSRRAMHAAVEALGTDWTCPLLAESDLPKPALIEAFRSDEATCLFATLGYWQGVDVPGPTLSLVTLDRIPFPRPDEPVLQARRERAGSGAFSVVDLPRAGTLLAQGAGRLIRSAHDRGVVAVLDSRLATARYRGALLARVPPMKRTVDRDEVVAFLGQIAAGPEQDRRPASRPAPVLKNPGSSRPSGYDGRLMGQRQPRPTAVVPMSSLRRLLGPRVRRRRRRPMSADPLVSVVLATNRNGPFLADTLRSLAAETYDQWELILVDDGSPDPAAIEATAAGIDGATVIHQSNAGVSVARNVGIAGSRGKYLAFLDDDDLWAPERLELQVAALESQPSAVASYCQLDFIDQHGTILGTGHLGPGDFHSILRGDTTTPIPTLLVARRALHRVGMFHPMLPPAEDLDLIYRLVRTGPFVFVPDVLVHYRRHVANESGDLCGASLASRRALTVQQWWSARRGETEVLQDLRVGLRHSRRYWTDQLVREAVREARLGHLSKAGHYATFVARHDLANGLRAVTEAARRTLSSSPAQTDG